MLGIGSTEFVIILVFGFLLFGPDKLPQMGHTIGRALRQFRETQEKLTAGRAEPRWSTPWLPRLKSR